jgi:hypothetical protein
VVEVAVSTTIRYDDRLCGRGKTTDIRKTINESSEKYLVVSPTMELNVQQAAQIADSVQIDSSQITKGNTVGQKLTETVRDTKVRNIIATHRGLSSLINIMREEAFSTLERHHLVLDEEFTECTKELTFKVGHEVAYLLLEWCSIDLSDYSDDVYGVTDGPDSKLEAIAFEASDCDVLNGSKQLGQLAKHIIDPLYRTFILETGHQSLKSAVENKRSASFTLVSFLCPTAFAEFKSVTCLSAFFRQTEFALASSALGVEFQDITPVVKSPTFANSERLHIHYMTERKWSSERRKLVDDEDVSNMDKVIKFMKQQVGNEPFIFNANTEDRNRLKGWKQAELVVETHGRNDLRHHTKAAFLGSRNASPQLSLMLDALGVDRSQIDAARTLLAGFQLFMRSNLREEQSEQRVDIYCVDKQMVDFMLKVFPKAHVTMHDIGLLDRKLNDGRRLNEGGARPGSGRKAKYPPEFEARHKKAYQRYKSSTEMPLPPEEWLASTKKEKLSLDPA